MPFPNCCLINHSKSLPGLVTGVQELSLCTNYRPGAVSDSPDWHYQALPPDLYNLISRTVTFSTRPNSTHSSSKAQFKNLLPYGAIPSSPGSLSKGKPPYACEFPESFVFISLTGLEAPPRELRYGQWHTVGTSAECLLKLGSTVSHIQSSSSTGSFSRPDTVLESVSTKCSWGEGQGKPPPKAHPRT